MSSHRGRLNWSNLKIHVSDRSIEEKVEDEVPIQPRGWIPKKEAAEMNVDHFVGNYMLTSLINR